MKADHQVLSVLSGRGWEYHSPFVTIDLHRNNRAKSSEDNGGLATKRHSWPTMYSPFYVEVSDDETA
jgi:hypothetical protein